MWARARRVPLRLEADDRRLHPAGPRASSSGRASIRTARPGWMVRPTLDADAPYVDAVVHGDGLTSLQFRRDEGRRSPSRDAPPIKGADVIQLERTGDDLHLLGGEVRRSVHAPWRSPTLTLGDEVCVGLALCSHNADVDGDGDLHATSASSGRRRTASCRTATTSAACSRSSTSQTGRRAGDPPLRAAVRGAELDAATARR